MEYRASRQIGIVVERRRLASKWQDEAWLPVAALPGVPASPPGTPLDDGDGRTLFYAGAATLELFRKETGSYAYNLAGATPRIYIVLRHDPDGPLPWRPLLATVAPDEAQAALEGGEDVVDGVPIPAPIAAWVADFIAAHPDDEIFHKRQRTPHMPAKRPGEDAA